MHDKVEDMKGTEDIKKLSLGANAIQVGGTHYRAHGLVNYQHWDMVCEFGLDYYLATASKYLFRWRLKHGVQDLQKCVHYITKRLELNRNELMPLPKVYVRILRQHTIYDLADIFNLDYFQGRIMEFIIAGTAGDLELSLKALDSYIYSKKIEEQECQDDHRRSLSDGEDRRKGNERRKDQEA